MKPAAETRVRVRYAETDQMGVVYYANYLIWMEVGRVEFCKSCGFNYRDMEREDGILLAVAEATCRYRYPARYDDEVVIKTWMENANRRLVTFGYEMREADSARVLATGSTKHVFLNREMQATRLPEKYFALFGLSKQDVERGSIDEAIAAGLAELDRGEGIPGNVAHARRQKRKEGYLREQQGG